MKVKIAHILHSVGGVDVSVRLILKNLNNADFENIVIHGTTDTILPFNDINKQSIKEFKLPIFREINIFYDVISFYKTYKILKNEKPHIIHTHSAKGGIIGRLASLLLGIQVLHTPQAFSYLSTTNFFKRELFVFIEKCFKNNKVTLLASSNSEMQRAINEIGFKKDKCILFNNAIEPILIIEKLSIPKTWPDNYICTVGRPSYQKNIDFLINVLNETVKIKDIHLVIMGVGYHADQLDMVIDLIDKLDLNKNVTLLNWTSRADVFNIISKSHLYVSAARYEGLPYSIIESLALAIPCVVSNCDGNRDLIFDNYNGYVISNNSIKDFSSKILYLLNHNDVRNRLSKNAKKSFHDNYNILNQIENLEKIYKLCANN